jgi:hypothetical protein
MLFRRLRIPLIGRNDLTNDSHIPTPKPIPRSPTKSQPCQTHSPSQILPLVVQQLEKEFKRESQLLQQTEYQLQELRDTIGAKVCRLRNQAERDKYCRDNIAQNMRAEVAFRIAKIETVLGAEES